MVGGGTKSLSDGADFKDSGGSILESAGCNSGIPEVSIINNGTNQAQVVINGQPIMFKGS